MLITKYVATIAIPRLFHTNDCISVLRVAVCTTCHMYILLQASNAYEAGAYEEALRAARTAKTLNIVGLIVGIAVFVTVCVLIGVGAAV